MHAGILLQSRQNGNNNLEELKKNCGFPISYIFQPRDTNHVTWISQARFILSKYPILRTVYLIPLPKEISSTSERPVFADIVVGKRYHKDRHCAS
jgi:hypothetical protein